MDSSCLVTTVPFVDSLDKTMDTTPSAMDSDDPQCNAASASIIPDNRIRVVARIRPMNPEETKRHCRRAISVQETDDMKQPEQGILSRLRCSFTKDKPTTVSSPSRRESSSSATSSYHCSDSHNSQLSTIPTKVIAESSVGIKEFAMDAVFGPDSTQPFVYQHVLPNMAEHLFHGYNTTILAYGQTGSGKTFTMGGQKDARTLSGDYYSSFSSLDADESEGIIPRAVRDIFQLKQTYEDDQYIVQVQLSCLEIYQDELRDLLAPVGLTSPSMKMQDHGRGVTVRGLQTMQAHTIDQVHELMDQATMRRTTACTRLNERSSRSHAICTIYVTVAPPAAKQASESVVTAKLTLVDLAGSERIKDTGVVGVQQQESININKDLFVLGKVVSALSERAKRGDTVVGHVPYRDSKLTRLLRDSLGGNCRTVLIACVSPADINVDESINTLRYAERSRTISNAVKQNRIRADISPSEQAALRAENKKLRLMVAQLRKELASSDGTCNDGGNPLSRLEQKLKAAETEAAALRNMSLGALDQATRIGGSIGATEECQRARQSIISPLLSYELSVGIADEDLESLLDESDSFWGNDDVAGRGMSPLHLDIASLKEEKAVLTSEVLDLSQQVAAQRSHLSVLRTNIKAEKQKRSFVHDSAAIQLDVAVQEQALCRDVDLENQVLELRSQLAVCQADNDQLTQQNRELQRELDNLREQNRRESLKHEISQIERKIEKIQSEKALSQSSTPLAKANVLQDSTAGSNQHDAPTTCSKSPRKRIQFSQFEEEKKCEDPVSVENTNPLQSLLDDISAASTERPYNDADEESYVLPTSDGPSTSFEHDQKIESTDGKPRTRSSEIKDKADEILGAAEKFFDHSSSHGSTAASTASSAGTFFIPRNDERDESDTAAGRIVISNIDAAGQCTCEYSMFGGRKDYVEFYLPKLEVACICGNGQPVVAWEGDPLSLCNILRPWQCEFLESLGLHGAEEYTKAFKDRGHAMAADMRRWRRSKKLHPIKTKGCVIALHIWSRTCRTSIRSVREQQARGVAKPERPDFLQISIPQDARSVSTMGFGSVVDCRAEL